MQTAGLLSALRNLHHQLLKNYSLLAGLIFGVVALLQFALRNQRLAHHHRWHNFCPNMGKLDCRTILQQLGLSWSSGFWRPNSGMNERTVLISGAGIAGPTLAFWLSWLRTDGS